jgi:hypothetical protein
VALDVVKLEKLKDVLIRSLDKSGSKDIWLTSAAHYQGELDLYIRHSWTFRPSGRDSLFRRFEIYLELVAEALARSRPRYTTAFCKASEFRDARIARKRHDGGRQNLSS